MKKQIQKGRRKQATAPRVGIGLGNEDMQCEGLSSDVPPASAALTSKFVAQQSSLFNSDAKLRLAQLSVLPENVMMRNRTNPMQHVESMHGH